MRRFLLPLLLAVSAAQGDGAGGPLLRSNVPLLGSPLHLDLYAAPGSAVLLALSQGPGPIRIGTFEVCLTPPILPVALDVVPPSGVFRWSVNLPPVPALVGSTAWFQALVTSPAGAVLSNHVRVALTDGRAAVFADESLTRLPRDLHLAEDAAQADVDRDGDPDLIVAASSSLGPPATLTLLINQGGLQGGAPGVFQDETASRFPPGFRVPALCVRAGDVDRDGDPDLFIGADDAGTANAPNVLLVNQGGLQGGATGTFLPMSNFPGGGFETQGAVFVDLDRDGFPELVLANGVDRNLAPQPDELLVNVGGLAFVLDPHFTIAPFNPPGENDEVVAGDFDGDGDQDLFFARDGQSLLLRNEGFLNFLDATADLPALSENSTASVAADFDRDGDVDLLVVNIGTTRLLVNQGRAQGGREGLFALGPSPAPPPASFIQLAAAVADVDNDGDLDLSISVHPLAGSERSALYLNQGGLQGGVDGAFVADPAFTTPVGIIPGLVFADVDRDGDLDLFLASQGPLSGGSPDDALLVNRLIVRP